METKIQREIRELIICLLQSVRREDDKSSLGIDPLRNHHKKIIIRNLKLLSIDGRGANCLFRGN